MNTIEDPIARLQTALHRELLHGLRSAVPSITIFCYAGAADSGGLSGSLLHHQQILELPSKPISELLHSAHADLDPQVQTHALLVRLHGNADAPERCLGIGGVLHHGDRRARQAAMAALNQVAPLLASLVTSYEQCAELTRRAHALQAFITQQASGSERKRIEQAKNEGLLSHRERQIARLLVEGYAAINAAAVLQLSEHTVRTYIRRLYRKLEVTNRADLVRTLVSPGYGEAVSFSG